MKILMLTDRMDAGGAETHVAQLSRGLKRLGVEVALMSGGGALADTLEQEGIRQYRAPLYSHNVFRLWHLRRRIRQLVREQGFEIVHAHARIPALLIKGCARLGASEIVTVHAHFRSNAFLSRLCYWGSRTVAVSEDLRAYVCDVYGIPAERVRVIPNGIDCAAFSPSDSGARRGSPRILFASRLDADCSMGAELLCKIAPSLCRRFPGVGIEIAGGGSELGRIRTLAESVNRVLGRTAVTVLGFVADMPTLMKRQDIFVGVSRAAMEAGASGCAVVLCGNEGYLGVLSHDNAAEATLTNFCCRGTDAPSEERLERDLALLLESPSMRVRCGEECRALIAAQFSAERMCRETLALYRRVQCHPKRFTLTVGGYFGCGNTGDDAILLGFLEGLLEAAPDISVIALTAAPHRNSRRFGVRCVCRRNPIAVRWALLRSHAFLCGGGSLLQNITSAHSLSYYLGLIRLAARMGKPCFLYAAGIGPLVGKKARRRVACTLAHCRYISLRDTDSQRFLSALGVDAGTLRLSADPALLMPTPPTGRAVAILRECGAPCESPYLCVVLRGGAATKLTRDILIAAVRMVCRRCELFPLFLVFDESHDLADTLAAVGAVGGRMVLLREPADAAAILSVCAAAVAMRLHALILAAAVGTAAVGIPADARDNKIAAFAKAAGQDFVSSERTGVAELVERIEHALSESRARRPILADSVAEMRKKARKDLANMIEMIYNIDNTNPKSKG